MSKKAAWFLVYGLVVALASQAAAQRITLPEGDARAGKEALRVMQCYACHEIAGSGLPTPHARLRGTPLGATQSRWSSDSLAAAILAPAHQRPERQMGDYSEAMTVRQLIDIVAYLKSLGS
jgi:cytochrome c2